MSKKQIIFFNGGTPKENFVSYKDFLEQRDFDPYKEKIQNWNKTLGKYLGEEYHYIVTPFHERDYADYESWKISFEKVLPYLQENPIVIATSLGGSFILKYIGENEFPLQIEKLFLIAPAIKSTPDEDLGSFIFELQECYYRVSRWTKKIYIYHSKEDDIVPFEQSLELKSYFPEAEFREFDDRGHFFLEERISELEEDIRN